MKLYGHITKVLIAFCLLYFSVRMFMGAGAGIPEQLASYVVYPFIKINQWVTSPLESVRTYVVSRQTLQTECEALREKLHDATMQVVQAQALFDYAQAIEQMHATRLLYTTDAAHIAHIMLKHTLGKGSHYILVDRGQRDGIETDMVAVYKNCLLGRIAAVYPWYSKVILITDQSCKVPVYCAPTKAEGVHEGLSMRDRTSVNFVSHLDTVNVDDMILSSGQGMIFPKGFMLGTITHAHKKHVNYVIHARPALSIDDIHYCYLIKKSDIR